MLIDCHVHNRFSPDSESDTLKLAKIEQARGIKYMAITNHAEYFKKGLGIAGTFKMDEALKRFKKNEQDIQKVQKSFPDLIIAFGAEIQYQQESLDSLEQFTRTLPFDLVLGSVHIVKNTLIADDQHVEAIFKKMSEKQAYTLYFEDMLKFVQWGHFDVVAHFDIVKKFGTRFYGSFRPERHKAIILKIIGEMKKRGIGMELNTGSLHKNCQELFPHPEILKWCVETGLQNFTLGSDAHKVENAGKYIPEALMIAKKAGITHLSTYQKHIPTLHSV